jgi:hypothetical protein
MISGDAPAQLDERVDLVIPDRPFNGALTDAHRLARSVGQCIPGILHVGGRVRRAIATAIPLD